MVGFEEMREELLDGIKELLKRKQYTALRELLCDLAPADIASLFEDLDEDSIPLLFRLLPKEPAAEVFVELDPDAQEMLIRGFSNTELKEVLDELYLDDAVDIVEEMPANVVKRILKHADPETAFRMRSDCSWAIRSRMWSGLFDIPVAAASSAATGRFTVTQKRRPVCLTAYRGYVTQ